MISVNQLRKRLQTRDNGTHYRTFWQCIHIDIFLLFTVLLLISLGLFILYSASNQDIRVVYQQMIHTGFALIVLFFFAQISPETYQRWAVWVYLVGLCVLLSVVFLGHIAKGGQRWLNFGFVRLQPSEI